MITPDELKQYAKEAQERQRIKDEEEKQREEERDAANEKYAREHIDKFLDACERSLREAAEQNKTKTVFPVANEAIGRVVKEVLDPLGYKVYPETTIKVNEGMRIINYYLEILW